MLSLHPFDQGSVFCITTIERLGVLKRGYNGVYHHWSKKHMRRYVNEFVFRLNEGNVRNHTMVRLDHIIRNAVGKRLTYEELTKPAVEYSI